MTQRRTMLSKVIVPLIAGASLLANPVNEPRADQSAVVADARDQVLSLSTAPSTTPDLFPSPTYRIGKEIRRLTLHDIDTDGIADIVVTVAELINGRPAYSVTFLRGVAAERFEDAGVII